MATAAPLSRRWSPADSLDLYNVRGWGNNYFSVNSAGHMVVHPGGPGTAVIDLKELVDEVRERGISLPLLIRFSEIIQARVVELNEAFGRAIDEYGYQGSYRGVYPIKVNQDRYLVERLVEYGRPYHFGLEAGSQAGAPRRHGHAGGRGGHHHLQRLQGRGVHRDGAPRLEARPPRHPGGGEAFGAAAHPQDLARRWGCGRASASARGCRPRAPATGRPRAATARSSASRGRDLLDAVAFLRENDLLDTFELLHFHLGSQISSIRSVKDGTARSGAGLRQPGKMGAPLGYLDVGGGLGVDYDGSQTNFTSSLNYTLQEYANDIVFGIMEVCDAKGVPHPIIVSESGRATVAHHAVLIIDVLGVSEFEVGKLPRKAPADSEPSLRNLFETYREVSRKNCAGVLPRRDLLPRRVPEPVQPRAPVARGPRARRGPLLGHLPEDPAHRALAAAGAGGARGARAAARGHLLLQLLRLPVAARLLGDRPALPGGAHPPPGRGAARAAPCWPTSPATRTARSTTSSTGATSRTCWSSTTTTTASPTTWASSWSGRTRRSWAICTTSSATPTPSTSLSIRRRTTGSRAW